MPTPLNIAWSEFQAQAARRGFDDADCTLFHTGYFAGAGAILDILAIAVEPTNPLYPLIRGLAADYREHVANPTDPVAH